VIPTSNQDGRQAKNRKKLDEIKNKSSPLKLLSQSQPNFAEMILGWSPSKIMSGISFLCQFMYILLCILSTVKTVHAVTSVKQSPVIKGYLFLVLSFHMN
jgi:hypothetical protein